MSAEAAIRKTITDQQDAETPLSILVVTQYFWPESFQINDVVCELLARGHRVTILTGKPNYPGGRFYDGYSFFGQREETWQGARIIRVPLSPRRSSSRFRLVVNYLSFALFAWLLGPGRLGSTPVDAIFVYAPSPMLVGLPALRIKRRRRVPMLFWLQDLWPDSVELAGDIHSPLILGAIERAIRPIYRGSDRVLIQSQAFRQELERRGVATQKVIYFPQSAGPMFRPLSDEAAAEEGKLMPPGFRVMFAGNIGRAQDFGTILGAAERLREQTDICWIIVGDGRRRAWLENEVSRRGLADRFHLLGRFPEERMPHFFAHADALLVTLGPSRVFALTIPTKVQAYLASGKPIVAGLDGEGARVIEEAQAGFCAPAGDPEALAAQVLKLYRLPQAERIAMGQRARAYSERFFDRNRLVDQLIGEIRLAANERRSS